MISRALSLNCFPCTRPHTRGVKHDPLFPGAVRIGAALRRASVAVASPCGDAGLLWLVTELWAADLGGSPLDDLANRPPERKGDGHRDMHSTSD